MQVYTDLCETNDLNPMQARGNCGIAFKLVSGNVTPFHHFNSNFNGKHLGRKCQHVYTLYLNLCPHKGVKLCHL